MTVLTSSSRLAPIGLCFVLGACTELLAYPQPPAHETSPDECTNRFDDDEDGLADCADPDCDGPACPEETVEHCSDGRDNDTDGFADAQDVRCWPESDVRVQRCASIAGARFAPVIDGSAVGWAGDAAIAEHPAGAGWVFIARGARGRVTALQPLHGSVEGLVVEAEVWTSDSANTWVGVVSSTRVDTTQEVPSDAARADLARVGVGFVDGGVQLRAGLANELMAPIGASWREPGWTHVEITVAEGRVHAAAWRGADRRSTRFGLGVPLGWTDHETLYFEWSASPAPSESALLASASAERPGVSPCGLDVPQITTRRASGLLDAARGPRGACALVRSAGPDGVEVVEWWSSDDAERWTRAGSVPIAAARIGDAALAWNDLREAFEGAVEYDDTITGRTRIALLPQVSAEPCAGFELHDVGYDAGEVTVRLDPAANLLGVTHTGEDELRLLLRIEGSTGIGWRTLVSPPSRDRLTSDGAPEAVTSALADVSAVQFRGSDRFGIFASVREQAAVVERREGWARLAPVLVPSEEAGSFDALSLETARLLLDEPQGPRAVAAGQVVYSAPYSSDDCSDCTRIGTARFCVAPLGRGAECDAVLAGRD